MCRRKSLGSPPESFWLCFAFGSQKAGRRLFTVQSDPDYSGADYPFHGFTGLGPLLLFKGFLTFGDAVTQLMPNSRKNGKRLKIFLPYMSNSYKGFDHEKGANCVIKTESGASLVAQWLRICLQKQGTRVRALVWEDPTCCGATRPVSHSY